MKADERFLAWTNRRGTWAGNQVIAAVIAVVLLAIGGVIAFQIIAAFPLQVGGNATALSGGAFGAQFNSTMTSLSSGTQSAWAIGNLLPLVILAVAIIGAVMGIMAYRGRG